MATSKISSSRQLNIDASLNANSNKITNLVAGTATTDAVNKGQLDAVSSGMAQGLLTPVADLVALKAVAVSAGIDKYMINVESLGLFRYDAQSAVTSDDAYVVTPTSGGGRWIKMSNQLQDHNSTSGRQGGSATESYHLSASQHALATQIADSAQSGLLSATDWAIFNGKQANLGFTPENIANRGIANGYATLNASSKVVQDPANAQTTPAASKIPISNASGNLNDWITGNMKGKDYVNRETPTGLKNGTNVTFLLAFTPVSGTDCVYLNGVLQEPGSGNDYTMSGLTIAMATAPTSTDKLFVSYWK